LVNIVMQLTGLRRYDIGNVQSTEAKAND
jgi:hypothetical protein